MPAFCWPLVLALLAAQAASPSAWPSCDRRRDVIRAASVVTHEERAQGEDLAYRVSRF